MVREEVRFLFISTLCMFSKIWFYIYLYISVILHAVSSLRDEIGFDFDFEIKFRIS